MDTTRDYHTKRSKLEREGQIPHEITYMWNLNYDTKQKQTYRHRGQTYHCQREGSGAGEDWEFEINSCKLIGWIKSKALWYSTGKFFLILCDKPYRKRI